MTITFSWWAVLVAIVMAGYIICRVEYKIICGDNWGLEVRIFLLFIVGAIGIVIGKLFF